ncbi:hypothetical protein [Streptomyces sp. NBRC 109706]|uniref:hypothetical protein n=1 Tax=Streptomyces sp. NBRC 109706 TaxID=1550035 RepID=UPI001F311E28|nr:hypothetical protein [Streptomyces sp. NBRC 109706]
MIGLVVVACLAAGLTTWLFRRRAQRRADKADQGGAITFTCLLRHPSRGDRWLRGRVLLGPSTLAWEPRTRSGAGISLPADLRRVGVRSPTAREAIRINGRSRIVECVSPQGKVLLAVMPHDADHLLGALPPGRVGE